MTRGDERQTTRIAGTWTRSFGKDANEYFHAWSVAKFIGDIAAAGKIKEYALTLHHHRALSPFARKRGMSPLTRWAGVEAQFLVGAGGKLGFARRDDLEPLGDFAGVELASGEVEIQLEVTGFGTL